MNMDFFMPTRIISGRSCIAEHTALFSEFGKRAMIITGKHSAVRSGALADVTEALKSQGIEYQIFDEIEPNPLLETCFRAGGLARSYYAQFIVGIGGGSPLDAAKAVAVFGANAIGANDLFTGRFAREPLPVIAVGTTAGTGSEVTQYSVLTVPEEANKKSFSSPKVFPRIAFVDPKYTYSMPREGTVSCGLDAFCHAVESYFGARASSFSRDAAIAALKLLWPPLKKLSEGEEIDHEDRHNLSYGSVYAGVAIANTGTCFPHAMGYQLTYWQGLSHGRATALFAGDFLRHCRTFDQAGVQEIYAVCGERSLDALTAVIDRLNPCDIRLSETEAEQYAVVTAKAKSFQNSYVEYPPEHALELYRRFCG